MVNCLTIKETTQWRIRKGHPTTKEEIDFQ